MSHIALLVVSFLAVAHVVQCALFTALPTPPWAPRILQGLAFSTQSISYTTPAGASATAPSGSFLAWGGGDSLSYNDTYVSLDSGKSWTCISGYCASGTNSSTVNYTASANTNAAKLFTQDDTGACKAFDPVKGEWYVFDERFVYKSSDAINWVQAANTTEYAYRTSAQCYVDSKSNIYIVNGQSSASKVYENDVVVSTDLGVTFNSYIAPWSQRDSSRGYSSLNSYLNTEVAYVMGGHALPQTLNYRPNDIYVSSNSGASWTYLTNASWVGRDHYVVVQTKSGIQVVLGGKTDALTNNNSTHLGRNDVWASLDGGYTWKSCGNAEWSVRQDHSVAIDSNGYLYISGGSSYPQTYTTGYATLQDMWQSTGSWNDVNYVSQTCGLTIPSCGVGLRGFPVVSSNSTAPAPYNTVYVAAGCNSGFAIMPTLSWMAIAALLLMFL